MRTAPTTSRRSRPNWRTVAKYAALPALMLPVIVLTAVATAADTPGHTPPLQPNTNLQYGFVMALLSNNPVVRSMGYQWVEYGAYWSDAEPSPGVYDWANVDNIIRGAQQSNLSVLIRVSHTPAWARDPQCATIDTCPPANPNDFGSFMYQLALHVRTSPYRPPGIAYEIWNEPNTGDEWGGLQPDPARYTGLLRAAYPQVKAADPSATVVAGAVTTVGELLLPMPHLDDIAFLQGMYNAGAAPYFDVLSDHPYGFASAPEADPWGGGTRLVFRRAEQHRAVMLAYGDGAKQIWATEMGWAMDPATLGLNCARPDWYYIFNPQQQADYLVRAHQWARSYWPWMGAMFVFNFDFSQASWYDQCHPFRFWSVVNMPAQQALANFVQNPPATYTPLPTGTPTPTPDLPPSITAVRLSATSFMNNGGNLTIEVDASDRDGTPVQSVEATIQYPDQSTQTVPLTLVSGDAYSGTWRSAPMTIPPNGTQSTQTYLITPLAIEAPPMGRTTTGPTQQIQVLNIRFLDVPADFWARPYIEGLANLGAVGGYADNTFRPNNSTTRGQLSKIVVLGFGLPEWNPGTADFTDVPVGSTFYPYVETAFHLGLVGGYPCGGPGEPCDSQHHGYFRPNNNVTRGQISKIVVSAAGWQLVSPPTATFHDVPVGSTFYPYVETASAHGIVGGYPCGGAFEPCDAQQRPYFRPGNNATRAQICKVVYLAIEQMPTPTPTPSPTATVTPTSTVTATPTFTATPVPTDTPTQVVTTTPTPTSTPTGTVITAAPPLATPKAP